LHILPFAINREEVLSSIFEISKIETQRLKSKDKNWDKFRYDMKEDMEEEEEEE